jgi:hypothetical protein
MPFRFSCFISYRAGTRQKDNPYIIRVTDDLRAHLSSELELLLDEEVSEVYLDRTRLQGGDFFTSNLQIALCESICMILLYTPTYFSPIHTFCAREYKAMVALEAERLRGLGRAHAHHGLILPVVLRSKDQLPLEISNSRHFYDFEAYLQGEGKMKRPVAYFKEIRNIAEYIAERYWDFSESGQDPCANCLNFRFPEHEEVAAWVRQIMRRRRRPSTGTAS